MKPKNYVERFDLTNVNSKFKHSDFADQMYEDLICIIEEQKGRTSIMHFNRCVTQLHNKYESIKLKSNYDLKDDLWNFIYASKILPLKTELFNIKPVMTKNQFSEEYLSLIEIGDSESHRIWIGEEKISKLYNQFKIESQTKTLTVKEFLQNRFYKYTLKKQGVVVKS